MGFRFKHLGVRLVVLLWGGIAVAGSGNQGAARITVLVNNSVSVSPSVLAQAEQETARIFRAAGIEIAWVNCLDRIANTVDVCSEALSTNEFVLHIVPTGRTSSDLVFGVAFLGEDGSGKYCNVFFDRVEEANHSFGVNVSQLLGTVAAHELGHLLLGSHAHTSWGIMESVWKAEGLRQLGMGMLLFSPEQSVLMKGRIMRERTALVGWGGTKFSGQGSVIRGQ